MTDIHPITFRLPLFTGRVNCYLLTGAHGRVLVDTGLPRNRARLDRALNQLCKQGPPLQLIVLTHGDVDHAGNARHLRGAHGVPVAMHRGDERMVSQGDMMAGRSHSRWTLSRTVTFLLGYGPRARFTPDITLDDGDSLIDYGVDASILRLPGHSSGSIAVLTAEGDLLCGDLLENRKRPRLGRMMDQVAAARISVRRLRRLPIRQVFPGHGKPFLLSELALADE